MLSQTVAFVPGVQVARARHAEGLLSGLSFAAKDVFAVRGHASTAGHPDYARTHPAASNDADVVAQLLEGAPLRLVARIHVCRYRRVAGWRARWGKRLRRRPARGRPGPCPA